MRNIIFSITSILFAILFGVLRNVWQGFSYFSVSCCIILCIYWIIVFVIEFIEKYYKNFNEGFNEYKVYLINSTTLTTEDFENNKNLYLDKYKRMIRKDKALDIFKILICLLILSVCIFSLF